MANISAGTVSEVLASVRRVAALDIGEVVASHGAGSLLDAFSGLADEVDTVASSARSRVEAIDSELLALRDRCKELDGTVDALDGVSLLKSSDESVELLRARNDFWQAGQLGTDGELIEQQIRRGPVAAEAARLLGYPVAVAKIPTSDGLVTSHLVPTRIISPPEGFLKFEDAHDAAIHFQSEHPRTTGLITREPHSAINRFHVLAAEFDSSPRTIHQVEKKAFGRTKERLVQKEVLLEPTTDGVKWIIRTDNGLHTPSQVASWPEGRSTPIPHDGLTASGVAYRHKSEITEVQGRIAELDEAQKLIRAEIGGVKTTRDQIIEGRSAVGKLAVLPDKPGSGNPSDWELAPIAQHSDGFDVRVAFDEKNMTTTIPLPGMSVAEAAYKATTIDAPTQVAIMQDASGVPHLTFTDLGSDVQARILPRSDSPDFRAFVNPVTGDITYLAHGTQTAHVQIRPEMSEQSLARLGKLVETEFLRKPVQKNNQHITFDWVNETEPTKVLQASNLDEAIAESKSLVGEFPDFPHYIVKVPGAPGRFALLQDNFRVHTGNRWTGKDGFHDSVIAIVQQNGTLIPER